MRAGLLREDEKSVGSLEPGSSRLHAPIYHDRLLGGLERKGGFWAMTKIPKLGLGQLFLRGSNLKKTGGGEDWEVCYGDPMTGS